MNNYIRYKVWDEIIFPFPNYNGLTIDAWEWMGNFVTHFTNMQLIIHAEIS